jgi:hypothetical protein
LANQKIKNQRENMSELNETITTPLTKLLKIKHPIVLAGMNAVAGPELAAAVNL